MNFNFNIFISQSPQHNLPLLRNLNIIIYNFAAS